MASRHRAPRRGTQLIEFAFVALILYLLLAAIIEFGRALFAAQVLQQAADTAARELSRTPMPPTGTLTGPTGMFATNQAAQQIYQEQYLVVDLPAGQTLPDFFADKPVLNRLLMPLMIFNPHKQVYQYPGQLVADAAMPNGFTVRIPIVQYTPGTSLSSPGTDAIVSYIPVVEEISPDPASDPFSPTAESSPFNLVAATVPPAQRGMIALRINYPFQAATLSAYTPGPNGGSIPITTTEGGDFRPYAGDDSLGRQAALGKTVRPFRRVLSAQAIYRREVFE